MMQDELLAGIAMLARTFMTNKGARVFLHDLQIGIDTILVKFEGDEEE
jgi:hypothetical protein